MICPRRLPMILFEPEGSLPYDTYYQDICTYCGGLDPAVFMARLEDCTVALVPTVRDFRVDVRNDGGPAFIVHGRPADQAEFFFQHLTGAQMERFAALLNEGRIKFLDTGYFPVRPYFLGGTPP